MTSYELSEYVVFLAENTAKLIRNDMNEDASEWVADLISNAENLQDMLDEYNLR